MLPAEVMLPAALNMKIQQEIFTMLEYINGMTMKRIMDILRFPRID